MGNSLGMFGGSCHLHDTATIQADPIFNGALSLIWRTMLIPAEVIFIERNHPDGLSPSLNQVQNCAIKMKQMLTPGFPLLGTFPISRVAPYACSRIRSFAWHRRIGNVESWLTYPLDARDGTSSQAYGDPDSLLKNVDPVLRGIENQFHIHIQPRGRHGPGHGGTLELCGITQGYGTHAL